MTWAIVVAAGSGSRFGGAKQFANVAGRSVVAHSVAACRSVATTVVLVIPADLDLAQLPADHGADVVVRGGPTRSASVRLGLEVVPASVETVVIHDAARPAAASALFERVMAALEGGADAAICAVAVTDTIKVVRHDAERTVVSVTLDRASLVAVQTPQGFRTEVLRRAHLEGGEATDDAALVESLGVSVVVVEGAPENRKLTVPADLELVAQGLQ